MKTIYIEKAFKKYPHIDKNLIISFYTTKKNSRIPTTKSFNQIVEWTKKFNLDINTLSISKLLDFHEKRCKRLESNNLSHPSVIDLSLYQIYAPSEEIAKSVYLEYTENKIKNMCVTLNSNPNNRKGATLEYQIEKYGKIDGTIKYNNFIKKHKNSSKRCKEYWILEGYNEEEAEKKVSEIQSTFSLEKCIEKYGKEDGYRIWNDRQNKWQHTLNSKTDYEKEIINKKKNILSLESYILRGYDIQEAEIMLEKAIKNFNTGYSLEALIFIQSNFKNIDNCFYGENEWWYINDNILCFYDFTSLDKKIIFEYHGEAFHPNINILTEKQLTEWKHPYNKKSALEISKKDLYKKELAISLGFNYFELYSNDSKNKKDRIIYEINELLSR